jgi:hypothetical protein
MNDQAAAAATQALLGPPRSAPAASTIATRPTACACGPHAANCWRRYSSTFEGRRELIDDPLAAGWSTRQPAGCPRPPRPPARSGSTGGAQGWAGLRSRPGLRSSQHLTPSGWSTPSVVAFGRGRGSAARGAASLVGRTQTRSTPAPSLRVVVTGDYRARGADPWRGGHLYATGRDRQVGARHRGAPTSGSGGPR